MLRNMIAQQLRAENGARCQEKSYETLQRCNKCVLKKKKERISEILLQRFGRNRHINMFRLKLTRNRSGRNHF